MPVSYSRANSDLSRSRWQPSNTACTSTGVSTRGNFFGVFNATTRRGFGSLLLM